MVADKGSNTTDKRVTLLTGVMVAHVDTNSLKLFNKLNTH